LPNGSFSMGTANSSDEAPQHNVTIANVFAVGKFEVTFAEWDACVADGGCGGYKPADEAWGRGKRPVINVSWNDAQSYVAWIRQKTGKPYRLLSEAEWEYAARAGTTSLFYWGRTASAANAKYDSRDGTAPAGTYPPNAFGLYDMAGNVNEWTADCYHPNYNGAPADGRAWTAGDCSQHVLRGGSWNLGSNNLRSANRDADVAGFVVNRNGFRIARGF